MQASASAVQAKCCARRLSGLQRKPSAESSAEQVSAVRASAGQASAPATPHRSQSSGSLGLLDTPPDTLPWTWVLYHPCPGLSALTEDGVVVCPPAPPPVWMEVPTQPYHAEAAPSAGLGAGLVVSPAQPRATARSRSRSRSWSGAWSEE